MCMIDYADGPVTLLSRKWRKARKPHKCSECWRVINSGENYLGEPYAFEGGFYNHKTCPQCNAAREWLNAECGGWCFGKIAEDLQEHAIAGDNGWAVKLLAAGIFRKWMRKNDTLWPVAQVAKLAALNDSRA